MTYSSPPIIRCAWGLIVLVALTLFQFSVVSAVCCQLSGGPGIMSSGEVTVSGKYTQLMKKIDDNETEINRLYTTIPIGFAEKQRIHREKIATLKLANIELIKQLDAAAMESFQENPKSSPGALQHVFETMIKKIDGKGVGQPFDPAGGLEIASVMIKSEFDSAPVLYQAFRASYALQDFERASQYLDRIESVSRDLDPNIRKQLDDAKKKWKREIQLRSEEQSADDLPRVKFQTSEGEFVVELFENQAPNTVANFISLVENKFYDGLTFHLVRPGQFAQTGCPVGNGSGDAGYKIANETETPRNFFGGTLGLANSGPDSAGSQFFITYQLQKGYDDNYVAFGRVIEGLDNVFKLRAADKTAKIPIPGVPSSIDSATVLRKRDHEYVPVRVVNPTSLPTSLPVGVPGGLPGINPIPGVNNADIPDVSPDLDPAQPDN